jgi:hypothetical protein
MKTVPTILGAAAIALLAQSHAQAANLTIVNVNAPAINCVFDPTCKVVVHDDLGSLTYAPGTSGPRLQSRTFVAKPGTPGAGKTAYIYRVDLSEAGGITDCVAGVVINFGPVATLPYLPNQAAHVYVITQGGIGSVGVKSAVQTGDVIEFGFSSLLCPGQSSFFFGLAAAKPPMSSNATVFAIGNPPIVQTKADVPQH